MVKMCVYKIKATGCKTEKYIMDSDNKKLDSDNKNFLYPSQNSIEELVTEIFEYIKFNDISGRRAEITFKKPCDIIGYYGFGLIIPKNLNLLERFILKKELKKRFSASS
ncbi:MAG: hypothetical protein WC812_01810 [Candidatus Pacearchaeota archaeon]|jgi:hypothetical protein